MPSKVYSAAITGLEAQIIEVEADVNYGLRSFNIVGLGDKAVRESKERVSSAIKSSNLKAPYSEAEKILINLAPADLKKRGTLYDLPVAISYLAETNQIKSNLKDKIVVGEAALNGKLRPIKGVLSIATAAREQGFKEIIVPQPNAAEAALGFQAPWTGKRAKEPERTSPYSGVENQEPNQIRVIGANSLTEVINHLEGKKKISPTRLNLDQYLNQPDYPLDLSWIKGQQYAKRALEIVAAGDHHLLMIGPPGTGKTLLAKAIPSILPGLELEECLEVTKIYSVAGLLPSDQPLISSRPFRNPHHSSSKAALIGGGNPPRAGEISLAHRGVLFLDEFPEFRRDALEALRQPIEEGFITISRAKHSQTFPAQSILVAASNPCPCGYLNHPERACKCRPSQIAKYRRKLSGPLIDRMDLLVEVGPVKYKKLASDSGQQSSGKIRKKVSQARQTQQQRFSNYDIKTNSEMEVPLVEKYCQLDSKSKTFLKKWVDQGQLSARGYYRSLKVARTIADLEQQPKILPAHVREAVMYRTEARENITNRY